MKTLFPPEKKEIPREPRGTEARKKNGEILPGGRSKVEEGPRENLMGGGRNPQEPYPLRD